jgi:A/G-specific adenine glycosylase
MYANLHVTLLTWYEQNGRHDLPWRETSDPYKIWISEIMLQQTQVKTVLERFYFPFLDQFPTLQSLAQADESEVLKMWEGLGYYTRARNLHKAAKQCKTALPQSVAELIALPGIGKSTAHAIAAFAYKTPVPILDANVKRILYRFFAKKSASEKELWSLAQRLFDTEHPFEYNQALMDLGSSLCGTKAPSCHACPLKRHCRATQHNPLHYPQKKAKKVTPIRKRDIVVFKHNQRYALKQRDSNFLKGMWGFIEYEKRPEFSVKKIGSVIQKYSHFHLHADVFSSDTLQEEYDYFTIDEIKKLPLSQADIKIIKMLNESQLA